MFVFRLGDNTVPVHSSNKVSLLSDGSIRFAKTIKSDEGLYQCRASNGIGNALSKSIRIDVNGKKILSFRTDGINKTLIDPSNSRSQSQDSFFRFHFAVRIRNDFAMRSFRRSAVDRLLEAERSTGQPAGSAHPAGVRSVQFGPVFGFEH